MNETDLRFIEAEFGIQLPVVYRRFMLAYPVPACAGNSDTELWDNPRAIVELNRRVHAGETHSKAWPAHLFAVGNVEGAKTAIDLRIPEAPVWWVARTLDAPGTGQTHADFMTWAGGYVKDLAHDLEADGLDPNGSAEQLKKAREAGVRAEGRCLLYFILIAMGIVGVIVAGVKLWDAWTR